MMLTGEEPEEKKWQDVAERRAREQQNYARSQKNNAAEAVNPKCYMDVSVGSMPIGRLYLELFVDAAPMAAENFRGLCTGEYGVTADGVRLDFISSSIYRVHPSVKKGGGYILGGDITHQVGCGGQSVFGEPFADEAFKHRHTTPGLLSSAPHAPNCNTSRFCITTAKCPQFDYRQVVFGKVTDGMALLERLEQVPLNKNFSPKDEVRITFCGQQNKTAPYEGPFKSRHCAIVGVPSTIDAKVQEAASSQVDGNIDPAEDDVA
ncbi:Peptidyl-prolyl cis-trans isomerase [Diplonema papillatum]|nr:Peptidyl-prolyl cis-trans isomerase [Diplonema papillatum]KAJ9467596.1 Peptidyl-prolyl cis-trans isomerase [Diplonema papillatum]